MYYICFTAADGQVGCNSYETLEDAHKDAFRYSNNGFKVCIIKGEYVNTFYPRN